MAAEPGDRMFAGLPAVFRDRDDSGDLARLLGVFEALFFTGSADEGAELPGIERQLPAIPALFSPNLGVKCQGTTWRTPDTFMHWIATWLSFSPHALFPPEALRRIVAGIVPLYGFRGTRHYLIQLLQLCFGEEISGVHVDDRPRVGFTIGESAVGTDTRLAEGRAFWFKVVIELRDETMASLASNGRNTLEQRLRAVIDFAKPAHTAYELSWRPELVSPPSRE
jgi:phage tail-like protein